MLRFRVASGVLWRAFVSGVLLTLGPACALYAQAIDTAARPDEISAFAAGSRIYTDYGVDDFGFTIGGDYTRHYRVLSPTIEGRFTHSNDDPTREDSFVGGGRVGKTIRKFTPYADFLLGYGTIHFVTGIPGYTHDNSVIYDVGAGLNYELSRQVDLKFDAQQQYWKLGHTSSELEPYNLSVGVTYHVPFGWRRHR